MKVYNDHLLSIMSLEENIILPTG